MSLISRVAQRAVALLCPKDLMEIARGVSGPMMARLEKKMAFIQNFVEENLDKMLEGLGREERAQLMNVLLPRILRNSPWRIWTSRARSQMRTPSPEGGGK
jgi:hypothetical protein